ncbi:hypothetical protein DBR39_13830 [Chryseobacterium sp. KBW03]|uniref:hypothetical protein n=1 Tax=Chryseobacterium sp. KBW03 TaxID=2153362 RepID=UPI000F5B4FBA|nr:hypothetical protein [Chryseobacterium sp. KBW03]RQO37962.1 hypothetical protein DBR39_13830 [Chryseobacterium sp. KBW03]
MNNAIEMVYYAKNDAFYAYLELCNATLAVPEKIVYEMIYQCNDTMYLERLTCLFELQHGNYEKQMKAKKEQMKQEKEKKKSFLSKLFKF